MREMHGQPYLNVYVMRRENHSENESVPSTDMAVLMQRKRARATTPRRRRRNRAQREEDRQRQERRRSWTVDADSSRASTATCSRRPLVPPWQKGRGRTREASKPSSAPMTTLSSAAEEGPAEMGPVPAIPPLGEGSANIVWWAEMVGLQDPMQDNDRVLDNQTIEAIVDNLRSMAPRRRTEMVARFPFLGAFLAELLRAINLSQLPQRTELETIEDDDTALMQNTVRVRRPTASVEDVELVHLMQKFDPAVPFGSKLCQLQGRLNGFDKKQCGQVACHLRTMTQRLRTLAGTTSALVSDRFLRLEALVATYYVGDVDVPLSLQIWTEGQLRGLVPYLNGGRTPESLEAGMNNAQQMSAICSAGTGLTASSASTDLVHVVDTQDEAVEPVPEYRVRRTEGGPWEPASDQEAAEFRAHDEAVRAESLAQEEADRAAFNQHEATMAQRWDDWALASEMSDQRMIPSRKRVRITICAGTSSGNDIGQACIEGVIAHDQQATVSFNIAETLVGGLHSPSPGHVNTHADPQLAGFERDHLPGLPEMVQSFLCSLEGRHWLWRLQTGTATADMLEERFGSDIAEAAQLWVAMQDDMEKGVKNLANGTGLTAGSGDNVAASTSGSSTMAMAMRDVKKVR